MEIVVSQRKIGFRTLGLHTLGLDTLSLHTVCSCLFLALLLCLFLGRYSQSISVLSCILVACALCLVILYSFRSRHSFHSLHSLHSWHSADTELYLRLDHESNTLCIQEPSKEKASMPDVYNVSNQSRINGLGIWLYLEPIVSEGRRGNQCKHSSDSVTKLFIGKWQINKRSMSALNRHLIWYVSET